MDRRRFLKTGLLGLSTLLLDRAALAAPKQRRGGRFKPTPAPATVQLAITDALLELVDRTQVYARVYEGPAGPRFPGPVLVATEGQTIDLAVENRLAEPHAFAVPGVATTGPIPPGRTVRLQFPAPPAGTWLYHDTVDEPVNRLLGLHGPLVVLPPAPTPPAHDAPYSAATPAVRALFDDLGASAHFPGEPWVRARTTIWLFHQIDPALHARAERGEGIDPSSVRRGFAPRYFLINGRSGFFASHDHDTAPHGRIGQPVLLRSLNAGLATHSPHIHGNHVYEVARDGVVADNVLLQDTWSLPPLSRTDLLLPFEVPPDVPPGAWPPVEEAFPLEYIMHCHTEMSQTAGGGNYPQGAGSHFGITGPLAPEP